MDKVIVLIKKFFTENWSSIIKPAVVLLAICTVITTALGFTNKLTASKIAELEKYSQQQTMQKILKADEYLEKTYEQDNAIIYYEALLDNGTAGYIFITYAKGYGGDVSVMTALNPDGTVLAVNILDAANETPGLGQNVTKESFYLQFNNKRENITVVKSGADGDSGEINAVTGATISSKAVTKAVNEALMYFDKITATEKEAE